ncbi:MAG: glycine zipper 2TM domain-containing protein [Burkholderiales bacterium]|nr:glycine zipper 2TM domain-containing protein [Burkholderiales bacterium]
MNIRFTPLLALSALALSLSACGHMSQRDENTAAGAVIGGVAGSILTGGSAVGTVGGAVVGGVIGDKVDPKKR